MINNLYRVLNLRGQGYLDHIPHKKSKYQTSDLKGSQTAVFYKQTLIGLHMSISSIFLRVLCEL